MGHRAIAGEDAVGEHGKVPARIGDRKVVQRAQPIAQVAMLERPARLGREDFVVEILEILGGETAQGLGAGTRGEGGRERRGVALHAGRTAAGLEKMQVPVREKAERLRPVGPDPEAAQPTGELRPRELHVVSRQVVMLALRRMDRGVEAEEQVRLGERPACRFDLFLDLREKRSGIEGGVGGGRRPRRHPEGDGPAFGRRRMGLQPARREAGKGMARPVRIGLAQEGRALEEPPEMGRRQGFALGGQRAPDQPHQRGRIRRRLPERPSGAPAVVVPDDHVQRPAAQEEPAQGVGSGLVRSADRAQGLRPGASARDWRPMLEIDPGQSFGDMDRPLGIGQPAGEDRQIAVAQAGAVEDGGCQDQAGKALCREPGQGRELDAVVERPTQAPRHPQPLETVGCPGRRNGADHRDRSRRRDFRAGMSGIPDIDLAVQRLGQMHGLDPGAGFAGELAPQIQEDGMGLLRRGAAVEKPGRPAGREVAQDLREQLRSPAAGLEASLAGILPGGLRHRGSPPLRCRSRPAAPRCSGRAGADRADRGRMSARRLPLPDGHGPGRRR